MADKFVALGINTANLVFANRDNIRKTAKGVTKTITGKSDKGARAQLQDGVNNFKNARDGGTRDTNRANRRSRSADDESDDYWSSEYDTDYDRERGRRLRKATTCRPALVATTD
jgi:hypothetical protein